MTSRSGDRLALRVFETRVDKRKCVQVTGESTYTTIRPRLRLAVERAPASWARGRCACFCSKEVSDGCMGGSVGLWRAGGETGRGGEGEETGKAGKVGSW